MAIERNVEKKGEEGWRRFDMSNGGVGGGSYGGEGQGWPTI